MKSNTAGLPCFRVSVEKTLASAAASLLIGCTCVERSLFFSQKPLDKLSHVLPTSSSDNPARIWVLAVLHAVCSFLLLSLGVALTCFHLFALLFSLPVLTISCSSSTFPVNVVLLGHHVFPSSFYSSSAAYPETPFCSMLSDTTYQQVSFRLIYNPNLCPELQMLTCTCLLCTYCLLDIPWVFGSTP